MELKEFEDLTVGELRKITEEYKRLNPDVKPAQELLEELNEGR